MAMRIIIFALLFLITIASALSLSCIQEMPQQKIDRSDIIFMGTVTDIDRPLLDNEMGETIRITFDVNDVYKGDVKETMTIEQRCWIECADIEGEYLILADDEYGIGMCDYLIPEEDAEGYLGLLGEQEEPGNVQPAENQSHEEPQEPESEDAPLQPAESEDESGQSSFLERILDWLFFWR